MPTINHAAPIIAYWFTKADTLSHGDGRPIIVGKYHDLRGESIRLCEYALHASQHPADALEYARGNILYQVACSGTVIEAHNKLGCSRRKYLARIDATAFLWQFARECALSVIDKWDAPAIVREYLETGRDELREASRLASEVTAELPLSLLSASAVALAGLSARSASVALSASAALATRSASWSALAAMSVVSAALSTSMAQRDRFAQLVSEAFQEKDNGV